MAAAYAAGVTGVKLAITLPALFVVLIFPSFGRAAPFCVVQTGIPPRCLYVDANACRAEANREGAECTGNAQELNLPTSLNGAFCVAYSSLAALCAFPDRGSCDVEAARTQGVCVPAPPGKGLAPGAGTIVDPFQVKRPY